jgi:hypothetical protein
MSYFLVLMAIISITCLTVFLFQWLSAPSLAQLCSCFIGYQLHHLLNCVPVSLAIISITCLTVFLFHWLSAPSLAQLWCGGEPTRSARSDPASSSCISSTPWWLLGNIRVFAGEYLAHLNMIPQVRWNHAIPPARRNHVVPPASLCCKFSYQNIRLSRWSHL